MASVLLGESNGVVGTACIVATCSRPVQGQRTLRLDDALRQRAARVAAAPPDITPSRIVHDWVQAAFAQHKL